MRTYWQVSGGCHEESFDFHDEIEWGGLGAESVVRWLGRVLESGRYSGVDVFSRYVDCTEQRRRCMKLSHLIDNEEQRTMQSHVK